MRGLRLTPGGRISEKDITRSIREYLRLQRGVWYLKVMGGLGQRPGVPDLLLCYRGRFIGIEIKKEGGRLSNNQERERDAITAAGGLWIRAQNTADVAGCLGGVPGGTSEYGGTPRGVVP
jgi:hypothetical protein